VISYSQNAEDVVLARALPAASGFYVDVGAGHPEMASVTKHFYDIGWHGINIEPRSDSIALLDQQRPRDINLRIAAGATEGTAELFVIEGDPDLSTIDSDDLEYLRDRGYGFVAETVPLRTLDGIFEEHGVTGIDFLKIDVEGSEADVLAGIDLTRWRPRVIVVESVRPWSRERNDAGWRTAVESQGYKEACFDGINLFFAADHDVALAEALTPASVLDDYETAAAAAIREELDGLRGYTAKLEEELERKREWEEEVTGYVRQLEGARAGDIAPLIDLDRTRSRRTSPKSERPLASARVAIVGTPQTGDDWIRTILADILDAKELSVAHPADVDWGILPDRFVIQLHWQRSQHLERTLRERGVLVISAARHPLDVLLSILVASQHESTESWLAGVAGNEQRLRGSGPGEPAFLEWATSARAALLLSLTPEWWSTPTTHRLRYEQLAAEPTGELAALIAQCELEALKDPRSAVEDHPMPAASHPIWREILSVEYVEALVDAHREVFVSLGYDPDDRALTRT
jgi:FkbM family methyltransferase